MKGIETNKPIRVDGKENIEALYKEGKISKASYYRGLKRGYVILNYHKPHKKDEALWLKDESLVEYVYNSLLYIARGNIFKSVWDYRDLAHEAFIYLIERGEPLTNKLFAVAKSYILALQRGKGSAKYKSSSEVSAPQNYEEFISEYAI